MGRDVFVVIRAAYERTVEACQSIIEQQISPDHVVVIRERPFEKALKSTYELGIKSQAQWLLSIDADLLPRNNIVKDITTFAKSLEPKIFQIQPLILDKFYGGYRRAGIRMYRISMLDKAINFVPETGEQSRPEEWVVKQMGQSGYKTIYFNSIAGLHDYEQFYRDIYRTCFVHGNKHIYWVPKVIQDWKTKSMVDLDYWMALQGVWAGMMSRDQVKLDIDCFPKDVENILATVGAKEKTSLGIRDLNPDFVERYIALAGPPPQPRSQTEHLRDIQVRIGWGRLAPYLIGTSLTYFGNFLRKFAERRG